MNTMPDILIDIQIIIITTRMREKAIDNIMIINMIDIKIEGNNNLPIEQIIIVKITESNKLLLIKWCKRKKNIFQHYGVLV